MGYGEGDDGSVAYSRSLQLDGEANATHYSMNRIKGILLATAGMALQWAALHCITFGDTVFGGGSAAASGDAWLVNSIVTFAVFLALFLGARRIGSLLACRYVLYGAAACLCAGAALLVVGYTAGGIFEAAIYGGNVLIACGTTPFIVAWGEVYRYLNPKGEQLFVTLVAVSVSVALYMVEASLPRGISDATFFLFLAGAVTCLFRSCWLLEASRQSWGVRGETHVRKSPLLLLVCIAVYSIPYNYLRGAGDVQAVLANAGDWSCVLAVTVFVIVAVALLEMAAEARGLLLVPSFVLFFMSAAMIVHLLGGDESLVLVPSLLYSGYYLFLAMVYLALGPIVATTDANPVRLFSCAMLANVGGLLAGAFLGKLDGLVGESAAAIAVLAVTYCILFTGFALLHGKSYSLFRINSFHEDEYSFEFLDMAHVSDGAIDSAEMGEGSVGPHAFSEPDLFSALCDRVGDAYGLSGREREVLAELVRGRTIASIAESLVLSENTIKAHTKAIYRKLDVHSREGLFECVEQFGKRGGGE